MSMTLKEACNILGVSKDASKTDINNAYREKIKQCHPDANRNAAPEIKRQKDHQFKQLVEARKIVMNPSLAAPETAQEQPRSYTSANQYDLNNDIFKKAATQVNTGNRPIRINPDKFQSNDINIPRTKIKRPAASDPANVTVVRPPASQYQQQSTARMPYPDEFTMRVNNNTNSDVQTKPTVYNTSKTIHGGVRRIRDDEEYDYYKEEDREVNEKYKSFSDIFRLTPSMFISVITLFISIYMLINNLTAPYSIFTLNNPGIIIALASIVKIFIYDIMISYYARKPIESKLGTISATGIETLTIGIICMIYIITSQLTMPDAIIPFAAMSALGVLITLIGFAVYKSNKKKAEKKSNDISYLG